MLLAVVRAGGRGMVTPGTATPGLPPRPAMQDGTRTPAPALTSHVLGADVEAEDEEHQQPGAAASTALVAAPGSAQAATEAAPALPLPVVSAAPAGEQEAEAPAADAAAVEAAPPGGAVPLAGPAEEAGGARAAAPAVGHEATTEPDVTQPAEDGLMAAEEEGGATAASPLDGSIPAVLAGAGLAGATAALATSGLDALDAALTGESS